MGIRMGIKPVGKPVSLYTILQTKNNEGGPRSREPPFQEEAKSARFRAQTLSISQRGQANKWKT